MYFMKNYEYITSAYIHNKFGVSLEGLIVYSVRLSPSSPEARSIFAYVKKVVGCNF